MDNGKLLREERNGISILTINRPQQLNALDYDVIDALLAAFEELAICASTYAVILTGAGDRAFSAGADMFGLASSNRDGAETEVRDFLDQSQRLIACIEEFQKPMIVAVNGLAYGVGREMAEAAYLAIASDHATFAKPDISPGFPLPFSGRQTLPSHLRHKRAPEAILNGKPIDAETAMAIGLISRVVPHEQLLEEAEALAQLIITSPPEAVLACLIATTRELNVTIGKGLAIEAMQFRMLVGTDDDSDEPHRFIDRPESGNHREPADRGRARWRR